MGKERWKMLLPALALCLLLSGCQTQEDDAGAQLPEAYSDWVVPSSYTERYQETQYVIALDRSLSMDGWIQERNAAAVALINSLPEDSKATAFFFSRAFDEISDILPMSDTGRREELVQAIQNSTTAKGGTDLGGMMQKALSLFSDQGKDSVVRHVVFVVTDGRSDGTGDEPERRDQEFFRLCRENRETVETYVVYVSDAETPKSLCNGLGTTPITLTDEDENADAMDQARSRLSIWGEEEAAKILYIPDISRLEAALLNFRFADMDAIYNRRIDHSMTVSFPVFPLHAGEIRVALCGGADAASAITTLKNEKGTDLLKDASVNASASILTLSEDEGLEPGLYTMDVSTSQPLSMVIACKYDYQVQYGFTGTNEPDKPPAGTPVTFHMRLSGPDGTLLESSDYITLFANVCESGEYRETLTSGEAVPLPLVEDLSLIPVISYGGVMETLPVVWEVRPTDLPPALFDHSFWLASVHRQPERLNLCDVDQVSMDRETLLRDLRFSLDSDGFTIENLDGEQLYLRTDGEMKLGLWKTWSLSASVEDAAGHRTEAQWSITIIWLVPFLVLTVILLAAAVFLIKRHVSGKKQKQAENAERARLDAQAREINQRYLQDISLNEEFIRAGLSWRLKKDGALYIGGLGLTDGGGKPRKGCRLEDGLSYTISTDSKDGTALMSCKTPIPFGVWKYSVERGRTELILKLTSAHKYQVVEGSAYVEVADYEYDGGRLIFFGVNKEKPRCKVELEKGGLKAVFRLEYYTDQEPFYQ